jgi:hypothetical protein
MPKNELESIADAQRKNLITGNVFKGGDKTSEYSSTHTRALSDSKTPINGKGTGIFLDTYNGGGDEDINGNPAAAGSGRLKNLGLNEYKKDAGYKAPDTTGSGMVTI